MDKATLKVANAIVRIVGVFETKGTVGAVASTFEQAQYIHENIQEPKTLDYFKNYWYPEFRDLYFLRQEKSSATILFKDVDRKLEMVLRTDQKTNERTLIRIGVDRAEVFLFEHNLHFFTIDLSIDSDELAGYSDLTFAARNFHSKVLDANGEYDWVKWIEKEVLCSIAISSDGATKGPKVDDYSGSKFKVFSIIDLEESVDQLVRSELLYDLGCGAPLGSAGGNKLYSPSQQYFDELMKNKISVFNNYDILPLFDSFTVLGHSLLDKDKKSPKTMTWSQSYFRVFLHNLFIKFNLFRYNSEMINDSVKVRDTFETFLNTYNISHISYNFLPNLMYQKHRLSLDIDGELLKFQERINRISQSIAEQRQTRANLLIGFIGFVTSLSSISPVLEILKSVQKYLGWGSGLFYTLVVILFMAIAFPVLMYLFPDKAKRLKRTLNQKRK